MRSTTARLSRRPTSDPTPQATTEALRPPVVVHDRFCLASDTTTDNDDPAFRRYMDECLERAKTEGKARKRKRQGSGQYSNKNPQIAFLRTRISRLNYGTKIIDLGIRPELDKEKLVKRYNRPIFGNGHCGASLRNDQFEAHFDSKATYYFWADSAAATPEILVMIDIDVHDGIGTPAGAHCFAELVKKTLFTCPSGERRS